MCPIVKPRNTYPIKEIEPCRKDSFIINKVFDFLDGNSVVILVIESSKNILDGNTIFLSTIAIKQLKKQIIKCDAVRLRVEIINGIIAGHDPP